MSHRLLHTRRTLALLVPLVLIAAVLSFDALSGQESGEDSLDVVATSLPVLPTASVAVMGNVLLASPAVAPLVPGPCVVSANGPVERAARTTPETVLSVQNESCVGSTLTSIGREQVPTLDPATDVIIIGGIGLEFDWETLAASCLREETRSALACEDDASVARASAANSFFSWRSLLQQTHRRAPEATIVVVAPPVPVSDADLTLGSTCCGDAVDGNGQVRAVFDTAGSLRRAVIESIPTLPIVLVDSDDAFNGHRLDDVDPWLSGAPSMVGSPTTFGANALAELLATVMPVGILPETPPTPAEIVLVLGNTTADSDSHQAIQTAADEWLGAYRESLIEPSVAVVPIATSAPVPPPLTTTTTTTLPPDDGPVGDDSAPIEVPIDDDAPEAPEDVPDADVPVEDAPVDEPADEDIAAVDDPAAEQPAVQPDRALQVDDAPAAGDEFVASFATSAAELTNAIGELGPESGVTSLTDLTTALRTANGLLTPTVENQQIIVRASAIDLPNASVDDIFALRSTIAAIDAEVTIVAAESAEAGELSDLLASTSVVIALASDADLGDALPSPIPPPVLLGVRVDDAVGFVAQDVHVSAHLAISRPASAIITWSADGQIIAAGQRTTLPTSSLGLGSHEITVDVEIGDEVLATTFAVDISADGDGVADDSCENEFDPFPTDDDGDGLAEACDDDDDADGLPDGIDPCPSVSTDNLRDLDLDGRPDRCDADNTDGPRADTDGDGFADLIDNCPNISQENQFDADHDGTGNACDSTRRTSCTVLGTAGDDNLRGTSGDDVICGLGGNDVINGLAGNDLILAGPGNDVVFGGADDDRIFGGNGADELHGSGGNDLILGEAGNDVLDGGFGLDILAGGRGADTVDGGSGPDIIFGGRGNDTLRGGPGADTITGDIGHDRVFGEDGADLLTGAQGQDEVRGGRGNDKIIDVETVDFVRGGSGDDLIDASPLRRT